MIRLKVTPVVGLPQFTGWSQVAESTTSASTRLVCVFAISGKHAGNVGRDVSDKISDFYYYDIEQFHEFIEKIVEFAEENDCKLFISCALINGSKSIFATRGGSVFLKRKEKVGQILFSKDETKIVGGSYTKDDVFVLTTYQASQFLNEIEQKFSQGFDVDIIITSVVPGLHAQTDSSLSAIVFINQTHSNEKLQKNKEFSSVEVESTTDDIPKVTTEIEKEPNKEVGKDYDKRLEISTDLSNSGKSVQRIVKTLAKIKILTKLFYGKSKTILQYSFNWLLRIFKKIIFLICSITNKLTESVETCYMRVSAIFRI